MKRSNKAGGNHVPRDAEYAFANAIVGCLSITRELDLAAASFPAMGRDERLRFVESLVGVYDRMEEAVYAATGRRYQLPEIAAQPIMSAAALQWLELRAGRDPDRAVGALRP